MIDTTRRTLCWLAVVLLCAAGNQACAGRWGSRGMTYRTLDHGGRTREFYLREAPGGGPYQGLILALHGGGGQARLMSRPERGRLDALAARDGYLVVYPQGIEKRWNDGRVGSPVQDEYRTLREDVDDVGFLTHLVERLQVEYNLPTDQAFVCGISNGGRMSLRLILERPEVFRAAGVVVMALDPDLWQRHGAPSPAVPVAFLNGTDDKLVPYEGGHIHFFRKKLGKVMGTVESVEALAEGYGCGERSQRALPDLRPDRTRTTRVEHRGCRDGAEVVLYESQGGGHAWPGGTQYAPRFVIGPVVKDFHASDEIWDFFTRHGLKSR